MGRVGNSKYGQVQCKGCKKYVFNIKKHLAQTTCSQKILQRRPPNLPLINQHNMLLEPKQRPIVGMTV